MKILFVGLKYEYGRQHWGLSFEYQNFYEVLRQMPGIETEAFFIDEKILEYGRDAVNPWLIQTVEEQKPDLLFTFLFTDELKKETIEHITKKTKTKTFNWFADDHWRFSIYSKYWAPLFTRVSTTDSKAVAKYKAIGVDVIKTQWACNNLRFKDLKIEDSGSATKKFADITFVGKKYGSRGSYIEALKQAGLPAEGYGKGWESGIVSNDEMQNIFTHSKINLNFTESPYTTAKERLKFLAKFFVKKEQGKYKFNNQSILASLQSFVGAQRRQIKARIFEIPAMGGFLLTGDADNLSEYYVDGKEIAIFKNQSEMLEKCRYYLAHEEERKAIAKAGYERTLREHTYEKRFAEIFKQMGLM